MLVLRYIESWDGETKFGDKYFPAYTSVSEIFWISLCCNGF